MGINRPLRPPTMAVEHPRNPKALKPPSIFPKPDSWIEVPGDSFWAPKPEQQESLSSRLWQAVLLGLPRLLGRNFGVKTQGKPRLLGKESGWTLELAWGRVPIAPVGPILVPTSSRRPKRLWITNSHQCGRGPFGWRPRGPHGTPADAGPQNPWNMNTFPYLKVGCRVWLGLRPSVSRVKGSTKPYIPYFNKSGLIS